MGISTADKMVFSPSEINRTEIVEEKNSCKILSDDYKIIYAVSGAMIEPIINIYLWKMDNDANLTFLNLCDNQSLTCD